MSDSTEAIERGEYLVIAGGCISCHRGEDDEESFVGGLALVSDFGTFYAPNITPDSETGIGDWEAKDFLLALQHGRTPGGSFYYPAFPYRAYAGLSDADVLDIGSYLMSLEPMINVVPAAETPAWLNRWAMAGWNLLADMSEADIEVFDDELVARGAYLARNLGHCSECHTPRNAVGILDASREFAGATLGEEVIEAINAEALSAWTTNNFDLFLLIGMKPDGDFV
ncbi:MAG: c-type cytochrome, partial [Gammaproteobacteria bacterium]|nr:c-type cytochrome [Gammaproteobacteria bacterium]